MHKMSSNIYAFLYDEIRSKWVKNIFGTQSFIMINAQICLNYACFMLARMIIMINDKTKTQATPQLLTY